MVLLDISFTSIDIWSSRALKRFLVSRDSTSPTIYRFKVTEYFIFNKSEKSSYAKYEFLWIWGVGDWKCKPNTTYTRTSEFPQPLQSIYRKMRGIEWLDRGYSWAKRQDCWSIKCSNVQEIINVEKFGGVQKMIGNQIPFSKLEVLQLENLFILTSIYYTALPFPKSEENQSN